MALLFVAVAAVLRWALPDALGPTPFLAFYLAWVGAAAFGGLGPGLLATVASWLCVDLLFDPTGSLTNFADPITIGRLVILLAGGLTVSLVAERMRRGRIHERRQARELARAKQEWERTFDAVPDLIAIIDPQHRILRANRPMAERLGVSHEGCTGLTCYQCVHNLDTPLALCPHDQSLADGREHSVEIYEERLGGYFFITCTPLYDQHGATIGTVHVARDITERKRAEERLRESEAQLRTIVENLAEGLVVADLDGRLIHWNRVALEMHGFASLEECRRRLPELVDTFELSTQEGETLPVEQWPLARILRGEDLRDWEVRVRRIDRDWERIFSYGGSLVRDELGQQLLAVVTVNDITQRKLAEEQLRHSEEDLNRAQAVAQTGSWRLNVHDNELLWSDETYRVFGIPKGTPMTYETFLAAIHPADREYVDHKWTAALGGEPYEIEHRILAGGKLKWVGEKAELELDENGSLLGGFGTVQDITERKQAEEAMREANERLQEQAEELQTQAEELQEQAEELTTANEELRESEQALRESEEQLRQLNLTLESKVAQRTAEVEHRARQLQKLTVELSQAEDRERKRLAEILHDDLQQVLAAAKFHLGLMKNPAKCDPSLQATVTQIDSMLKDAIDKSRSLSHELSPAVLHHGDFGEILGWLAGQVQTKHGLVVHVHAHGQASSESDAIKTFLYKAAQELLFNVVKHARVNEAKIRVRRLGHWVCLSVSDHGRGFDPQTLKGTHGFGLFSLRERVELLGGRMRIKSGKDKGSTFFIVVPDGERVAVPQSWQQRPALTSRGRPGPASPCHDTSIASDLQGQDPLTTTPGPQAQPRLRVLLADDHEIVREGLISLLGEECTIEVVGEAANGREAINLAGELLPDVVIMDVSMPLINGDEATRQIKQLLPNARVIALSMFEDSETMERMHAAGAEAYILKTAPSEDLLAAIRGKTSDSQIPPC